MSDDTLAAFLRDLDASRVSDADKAKVRDVLRITSGRGTYREARECAGLSIAQAARLLTLTAADLRAIEAGTSRPSDALRVMMMAMYDVDGFAP